MHSLSSCAHVLSASIERLRDTVVVLDSGYRLDYPEITKTSIDVDAGEWMEILMLDLEEMRPG